MPELPEIETIRRDLEKALTGEVVERVDIFDSRLMNKAELAEWRKRVIGQTWQEFGRKGKYLWVHLPNAWRVMFHMRMTGQMLVDSNGILSKPRLLISFKSGKTVGLHDQRRFAEAWLLSPERSWPTDSLLGPDALNELSLEHFSSILKGRTTRIQPVLLDQRLLSGVGNIYAQEALFKAGIRPTRAGNRVTRTEASRLFETLKETLETAITYRGSSSRNYRDASGQEGSAQTLHAVYRKGGTPCPRCQSILRAIRVGGRGSVYCSQCQK